MYETNYYRPGEEAREADELFGRIPKGSKLLDHIWHYGKPRSFDELMLHVSRWCQSMPYKTRDSPVVDVSALPTEIEEDEVQVNNLNAARMARQPLQGRGKGGGPGPGKGQPTGRAMSAPVRPPALCHLRGTSSDKIVPKDHC